MVFKNPLSSLWTSEDNNSFDDTIPPEPSFVHEDFEPTLDDRCSSIQSDDTGKTAVVVPSLVTLARAFMWDHLPAGYSVYGEKESTGDIEVFNGEKRTWKPLNWETDPDPERPHYGRTDSMSSTRTDAPGLDEDDPRITGIAHNRDDVIAWRKSFEENEGRIPTREDEAKFYQTQCEYRLL